MAEDNTPPADNDQPALPALPGQQEDFGSTNRDTFFPAVPPVIVDKPLPPLPKRSGSSHLLSPSLSVRRTLSNTSQRARGLMSSLRLAVEQYREKQADKSRAPQCKSHGTRTCAEHLHWLVGPDYEQIVEEDVHLEVGVLTHDNARFDPHSDPVVHAAPGLKSLDYERPKKHWFHHCSRCGLSFLRGSAGNAVHTHPSHLASVAGHGLRSVAVFVDAQHRDGLAQWTAFFGQRSPYNVVGRTAAIPANRVELHAVAECLSQVMTQVVEARRASVRKHMVANSVAFALSAQRFTLLVFSPLKAALMLCPNEEEQVLEYNGSSDPPTFSYSAHTQPWVTSRRMDPGFNRELERVTETLQRLSQQGVDVKFAYVHNNGPYKPEWDVLAGR